jgi:membrane glycosyltransferase
MWSFTSTNPIHLYGMLFGLGLHFWQGKEFFSFVTMSKICTEAHLASYAIGTMGLFPQE